MTTLPLFPVTTVGSWPRPLELLRAQKLYRQERISEAEFEQTARDSIRQIVHQQEEAGADLVTDGEQRRDNFVSFVAARLNGTRLMTLLDMLEIIDDKANFERLLQTLDVRLFCPRQSGL